MELNLKIILQKPPIGVYFGLQNGSGTKYDVVQIQNSKSDDLHFKFNATLKGDPEKDPMPDFKGPFVQGPLLGRFIYISIGALAGQTGSPWSRRLKIPLSGIGWEMIDLLAKNANQLLQTFVAGTMRDGTPNCATVKPFAGWQVATLI